MNTCWMNKYRHKYILFKTKSGGKGKGAKVDEVPLSLKEHFLKCACENILEDHT